jgi:hypothetical protein
MMTWRELDESDKETVEWSFSKPEVGWLSSVCLICPSSRMNVLSHLRFPSCFYLLWVLSTLLLAGSMLHHPPFIIFIHPPTSRPWLRLRPTNLIYGRVWLWRKPLTFNIPPPAFRLPISPVIRVIHDLVHLWSSLPTIKMNRHPILWKIFLWNNTS